MQVVPHVTPRFHSVGVRADQTDASVSRRWQAGEGQGAVSTCRGVGLQAQNSTSPSAEYVRAVEILCSSVFTKLSHATSLRPHLEIWPQVVVSLSDHLTTS